MTSQIYREAKYYEIAFSFIDPVKQVDLFGAFIKKFSKRKVHRVLDIACGTAPQLREFARRGYDAYGLDMSSNMLSYLAHVAQQENITIHTLRANMARFTVTHKVDFAYIMMGSIVYLRNNAEFLSHLDAMARAIQPRGLYLIENMPFGWADKNFLKPQTWVMKKDEIRVKTTYQISIKEALRQIITQRIAMEVKDGNATKHFIDTDDLKLIFPEELKTLIAMNGKFELIGFFERNRVTPLKTASGSNTVILRRK
jgi:ubiquinone/menaquinone biosynthesis C-methylase UbiE